MAQSSPFSFQEPPVQEVACGVAFKTEKPLNAAFQGLFWAKVRDRLPRFEDRPPGPVNVRPTAHRGLPHVQMTFQALPPLRRAWLLDEKGCNLIQLQQELFTFNWRKGSSDDVYPRFPTIYNDFVDLFLRFEAMVASEGFGKITSQQFQLTYVNHIDEASGLGQIKAHEAVNGPSFPSQRGETLVPEGLNWSTTYILPENLGRLTWVSQLGLVPPKMKKALRLNIAVAGIPMAVTAESRDAWFQEAHNWICELFISSTNPKLHSVWGKA